MAILPKDLLKGRLKDRPFFCLPDIGFFCNVWHKTPLRRLALLATSLATYAIFLD